MASESLNDLVWKMECKGYDAYEIHFWITGIWCILGLSYCGNSNHSKFYRNHFDIALAQAHVEIDFTNYKKNSYVEKELLTN
jgi:hypothetical protein